MSLKSSYLLLFYCMVTLACSLYLVDESDRVTKLDDYPLNNIEMYSGYLSLDSQSDKYHYLFVKSETRDAPLLLWINSGSGCSSLLNFFYENGPYIFDDTTKRLIANPYSLNKIYNILYIDTPTNYGYSSVDLSFFSSDLQSAELNYGLLVQFTKKYSAFSNSDLILGSSELGAIQISYLANYIRNKAVSSKDFKLNFKAVLLGNPILTMKSKTELQNQAYDWAFTRSLYPPFYKKTYDDNCRLNYNEAACNLILDQINNLLKNVNLKNLYYPCKLDETKISDILNKCDNNSDAEDFFNKTEVKLNLHVGSSVTWKSCNPLVEKNYKVGKDSLSYFKKLVQSGIKTYIYVHDSNAYSTVTSIISDVDALNLNLISEWSDLTITINKIQFTKGYTRKYSNLSIFTLLSSGYDRPAKSQLVYEIASRILDE